MATHRYPVRDKDQNPIGATADADSTEDEVRMWVETTQKSGESTSVTPAEGYGFDKLTYSGAVLDEVLSEIRKLNKYMALMTGVEFED